MNIKKAKKALEQTAKQKGVSVADVRHEIKLIIAEARNNSDPKIQAFWKAIPCKGEYPTPEELIAHVASNIKKGM